MKLTVLMENSAAGPVACAHGLSLFVEAAGHRILFDAGPDGALLVRNAAALGVDLASADLAVLSHGHYDHSGGMEAFLERNEHAALCLRRSALEPHGALCPDGSEEDVGVSPTLASRFAARLRFTEPLEQLAPGLTLFSDEPGTALLSGSFASFREAGHADDFGHEQNLLLSENGLLVLLAGCAHRGIVNILDRAAEIAGRAPDAVFAGFHLTRPGTGMDEPDSLIRAVGERLAAYPNTVYYTGHCTGAHAYQILEEYLPGRLHPMSCGGTFEIV